MTRGFLLIDQKKNTIIIKPDDPDLKEFIKNMRNADGTLDVKAHNTLKELDDDVRKYLKDEYDG